MTQKVWIIANPVSRPGVIRHLAFFGCIDGVSSDFLRCSSDGKSVRLKSGRPLARTQPPELVPCPTNAAYKLADWVSTTMVTWRSRFESGNSLLRRLARANCVHDVAAACYLAMVDVWVQLPLDA